MSRKTWINAHLYVAAFFAPALIIIATSGGLYLLGIKGTTQKSAVQLPAGVELKQQSATLENDVRKLLSTVDPSFSFEYLKLSGQQVFTRPTSRRYFEFNLGAAEVTATQHDPDVVKRLVELHKGHGPLWFKDFQKFMAAGLLFVILSGTWLGLSARGLRRNTGITISTGFLVFVTLAFLL